MKSNNTIEINGKLYDAKTGAPLNPPSSIKRTVAPLKSTSPVKRTVAPVVKRRTAPNSVDGFSRRTSIKVTTASKPIAKPVESQKTATVIAKNSASRLAAQTVKQSNRKSLTLNRCGVQSPEKCVPEVESVVEKQAAKSVTSSALKYSDNQRFARAQKVSKSTAVARFKVTAQKPEIASKVTPAPESLTKQLTKTHEPEAPEISTKERLIKQAVASAVSTAPSKAKKTRKKPHSGIGKYASSALVAVVLAGYVAYLNVPSISMKVAAHRAGFAAAMPTYKPAGYSLRGPIAYSPGQVTVNFKSNTDDRKFSLKQQPTTWDSMALLENYVTKQSPSYLTYQDKGLTIYIYDGSSAAWVNGGTLYNLEGKDSKLDTDQLLKLATSV